METTCWLSWQQRMLCISMLTLSIITAASSSLQFQTPQSKKYFSSTSLAYAGTTTSSGPMSQVDSNARSGGCPFLVKSQEAHETYYAVPALFRPPIAAAGEGEWRPIVLFDGSCNLCNKFVRFLLKHDRGRNLRFAALQSKVADLLLRRLSEDNRNEVLLQDGDAEIYKSVVVLCTPDATYIQSSAILKILAALSPSSSSAASEKPSKRIKLVQYLGLCGYVFPTKVRDSLCKFVSKRRKSWFGSADTCVLFDERFQDRFVDDGVLTGVYYAKEGMMGQREKEDFKRSSTLNLFETDNPPQRGDEVRIIWPSDSNLDPSITYDEEFPDGLCLIGGRGTISTIDLPLRVVVRVNRKSIGLEKDVMGEETMIAWVKPSEVALI
jgi:predicted DCC family thiol-disulfide oxidoreductase YuxK